MPLFGNFLDALLEMYQRFHDSITTPLHFYMHAPATFDYAISLYPNFLFRALGDTYFCYLSNYPSWKACMDGMNFVRLVVSDRGRGFQFYLHCKKETTIQTLKHYITTTDPKKRCPSKALSASPLSDQEKVRQHGINLSFGDRYLFTQQDDTTVGDYTIDNGHEYCIDFYGSV